MDKIYPVFDWMKANPVLVVCGIVVLVSLGVFWHAFSEGDDLESRMADRESDLRQLSNFYNTSVTAPGPEPDDPPLQFQLVANDPGIEQLDSIYENLKGEFRGIYEEAIQINQQDHEPMLDGLFPSLRSQGLRWSAPEAYVTAYEDLYDELNAGQAASPAEVDSIIEQERSAMMRQLPLNTETLSEEQEEQLLERQKDEVFRFLREHATYFRVFADPVDLSGEVWEPGPFHVGEWALDSRPRMWDMWEGQMRLWIQQDLVRAINLANAADSVEDSVLSLPIKRILSIEVLSDYIGLNVEPITERIDESQAEQIINQVQSEVRDRLPRNYELTPTGRISNALYDVRHAEVSLIVDSQQLPAVLNAFDRVNFMTVIGMDITNVDEYDHLLDGYYYGAVDAVQVDLLVETIWFRAWTVGHLSEETAEEFGQEYNPGLMPDVVRASMGLPPRDLAGFDPESD